MALGILLLHTLVDDSIFGYGGAGIPALFIPLGLLIRSGPADPAETAARRLRWQPAFVVWGVAIVGLIIGLILPQGRAVLEVNLGALQQTQQELLGYHWPDVPLQDVLRRPESALSEAVPHYQQALQLDANNAAAHRHLGQIELAREQYESACQHLTAAYATNPNQRATRQLLGECAALSGEIDRAVELWRPIDLSQQQLRIRQWWYEEYLRQPDRAAALQRALAALGQN
jgi:lipopolysaccharide biosynthesis regulator YciM